MKVSDIFVLTVRCELINFVSLLHPEMSPGFKSYFVPIIPIYVALMLQSLQFGLFSLI
jgi:hypothetical protein